MEKNGGMVAVVQGLQDSGLTVTLLDGGNQYTLMPNKLDVLSYKNIPRSVAYESNTAELRCRPSVNCASQYATEECSGSTIRRNRENGIQATDGRYTSTYKMMHCNVNPTSPPQTVTEFPPQKPEVVHGHGNFVIGGYGSGETSRPTVKSNSFKGGMVWPDKGSVCASRASVQSDAFANSLRKYPCVSPDRSTEIVERLISFTQAKNLSKTQNRCSYSPTRYSMECGSSKQTFVLDRASKASIRDRQRYNPEDDIDTKRRLNENRPVRDSSSNFLIQDNEDSLNRPVFCKNNDVRCFRDTNKKNPVQGLRNPATSQPTCQFYRSPYSCMREQYDCEDYRRNMYKEQSNNSVNMEIQAAAQMESKEILTLPRIVPMQRTIATPLSPIPSTTEGKIAQELKSILCSSVDHMETCLCKSIQVKLPLDTHVTLSSSSFDLRCNKRRNEDTKRSRSEELNIKKKPNLNNIQNLYQHLTYTPVIDESIDRVKDSICENKICCKENVCGSFDLLRRSVSVCTDFDEGIQLNINHQETSNNFTKLSNLFYRDRNYRNNKNKYKNQFKKQLESHSELCSSLNACYDSRSHYPDTKDASRIPKNLKHKFIDNNMYYKRSKRRFSKGVNVYEKNFKGVINYNDKIFKMTQEEMKNLLDLDILAFTEKYGINITTKSLNDLVEELYELFLMYSNNKQHMIKQIKNVLQNRGLSDIQSIHLTNILIEHWEEKFLAPDNKTNLKSLSFKSDTLIVLPNLTGTSSQYKQNNVRNDKYHESSNKDISQNDIDANVKVYISKISNEISEWLSDFLLSETQDAELRLTIISDLATDVVDRHKYLELNPSSALSETSELEHLRYQIFKLIYKIGINDMTLVDHAIDLMRRIENIAVPKFSLCHKGFSEEIRSGSKMESEQNYQNVLEPCNLDIPSSQCMTNPDNECCNRPTCKRNRIRKCDTEFSLAANKNLSGLGYSDHATTSSRRMSIPGKLASTNTENNEEVPPTLLNEPFKQHQSSTNNILHNSGSPFSGGIEIRDTENFRNKNNVNTQMKQEVDDINQVFNQYLKEWVEKITLPMINSEDEMVVKKARIDIYNGILLAVSSLRSDPDIFNNRFLFEDLLNDEIEKLMSNLPQSSELNLKKHFLKVKLIEKISDINELMKTSIKSYKQQLVENLKDSLPRPIPNETENPDILEVYEDLQILNLVEDFILCSRYQNKDPVIAEAYRKKLLTRTKHFVEELKANHNKALKNIDTKLYLNDILNMLQNVALPSEKTIQDEADEILLSVEIDKWFAELPLIPNNDFVEELHRRRLKNKLAKQILDVEKGIGNTVNVSNNLLKHEISQFLGKAPLQQDESLNINSMVDNLIKRLKDMPKVNGYDNKKVIFNEPGYEEFSRNIPLSSTYTGEPRKNITSQNKNVLTTKPIQAIDQSQHLHSGHYHNISKPLFDDLIFDQNCSNGDLSLQQLPNYDTFDKIRPRSSSLKYDSLPQWHTLQESRQGYQQSNISLNNNNRNRNRPEQSNNSIQAKSPREQSQIKHYRNILKPQPDNLKLDTYHHNDNHANEDAPQLNGNSEHNWYTLQESKLEDPNLNKLQYSGFAPNPLNVSERIEDQGPLHRAEQYVDEPDYIVPQNYLGNVEPNDHATQNRNELSYQNRRNPAKKDREDRSIPIRIQDEDIRRPINNQGWSNMSAPIGVTRRSYDRPRFNQQGLELDQADSSHQIPYNRAFPTEPNTRNISNQSPRLQTMERTPSRNPQSKQSNLFYRSTDREGLRQTTDRYKDMEANMSKRNIPDNFSEHYQPPIFIPPPGYVPLRLGHKKGSYVTDRTIGDRLEEEESEDENDEYNEIRCPCVQKIWKKKQNYKYCPFEQYDGFPMYLTSPYYYPYFY